MDAFETRMRVFNLQFNIRMSCPCKFASPRFYISSGRMNFENTIAHFALGRGPPTRLKFPVNLSSPLVFTALKHFQH